MSNITCTAPATSILIDTNKGLRPCCYYQDGFLGNINEHKITDIIKNEKWQTLKQQMTDNEWPKGCLSCKKNEENFGTSLRQVYFDNTTEDDLKHERLTYLEFNGSNICNLSCVHCHSLYSSRWVIERQKLKKVVEIYDDAEKAIAKNFRPLQEFKENNGTSLVKMHLPNPELVLENIKDIDFSQLKILSFRGGEPLLNSETTSVLQYLDSLEILKNLDVLLTTNCTYINDEIIKLLANCKSVTVNLSIDGVYELFNYIRYGDAKFEDVEPVIAKLNTLPNVNMMVSAAPMNYNAFNLLDIREWSIELSKKYNNLKPVPGFNNCVVSPIYLSLATLSDNARKELIDFYKANSIENEFEYVINLLSNEFLGDDIHTQWTLYTKSLETVRGNNITSIVPQLKKELRRN